MSDDVFYVFDLSELGEKGKYIKWFYRDTDVFVNSLYVKEYLEDHPGAVQIN